MATNHYRFKLGFLPSADPLLVGGGLFAPSACYIHRSRIKYESAAPLQPLKDLNLSGLAFSAQANLALFPFFYRLCFTCQGIFVVALGAAFLSLEEQD